MLKCNDLSRLVAADEIEEFGFMQRVELKFHLFMCRHCRNYVAQIRSIGQGARDLAAESAPDDEQVQHLEKKICDHLCNGHRGSE
jgi:hypothetical protein